MVRTTVYLIISLVLLTSAASSQVSSQGFDVTLKYADTLDQYLDMLVNPDGSFYVVGADSLNGPDLTQHHQGVLSKFNADFSLAWRRTYGGSKTDWFTKIKRYKDGTLLIGGHTWSNDGDVPYGFANTVHCPWVLILDSTGNILHGNAWGYGGQSELVDISVTSDYKIFITGATVSNLGDFAANTGPPFVPQFFTALADSQLNKKWVKLFVNIYDAAPLGQTMLKNDILLTGASTESNTGDYNVGSPLGSSDLFLFYIDTNQTITKKARYGGSNTESAYGIIAIDTNNILLHTPTRSTDGNLYANEIPSTNTATYWHTISKLDSSGTPRWNHLFGAFGANLNNSGPTATQILDTTVNRYWVYGYVVGNDDGWIGHHPTADPFGLGDAFLWQFDTSGHLIRKLRLGGKQTETLTFLRRMPNGKYIIGVPSWKDPPTDAFSCYPNTSCFSFYELTEWPLSVQNTSLDETNVLSVYPNPSTNELHIYFKHDNKEKVKIRVLDQLGKEVLRSDFKQNETVIEIKNLIPGTYYIQLDYKEQKMQSSFIKKQ